MPLSTVYIPNINTINKVYQKLCQHFILHAPFWMISSQCVMKYMIKLRMNIIYTIDSRNTNVKTYKQRNGYKFCENKQDVKIYSI